MTAISIRRKGDYCNAVFIGRNGDLPYEPCLNNQDTRRLINILAAQAGLEPAQVQRESCRTEFRVVPGPANGFTRLVVCIFRSAPDFGSDGELCTLRLVNPEDYLTESIRLAFDNFESDSKEATDSEGLSLKDRALRSWQQQKKAIKYGLEEEFRKRLRRITGVDEVTVNEPIDPLTLEPELVGDAEGIKFSAGVNKDALTLDQAITVIRMIGACPWCKEETQSVPLGSFLELGKNIESFEPTGQHRCKERPFVFDLL